MKKLLMLFVLIAFLAAVAFATLSITSKKQGEVKKTEKKELKKKHHCSHTCLFS